MSSFKSGVPVTAKGAAGESNRVPLFVVTALAEANLQTGETDLEEPPTVLEFKCSTLIVPPRALDGLLPVDNLSAQPRLVVVELVE